VGTFLVPHLKVQALILQCLVLPLRRTSKQIQYSIPQIKVANRVDYCLVHSLHLLLLHYLVRKQLQALFHLVPVKAHQHLGVHPTRLQQVQGEEDSYLVQIPRAVQLVLQLLHHLVKPIIMHLVRSEARIVLDQIHSQAALYLARHHQLQQQQQRHLDFHLDLLQLLSARPAAISHHLEHHQPPFSQSQTNYKQAVSTLHQQRHRDLPHSHLEAHLQVAVLQVALALQLRSTIHQLLRRTYLHLRNHRMLVLLWVQVQVVAPQLEEDEEDDDKSDSTWELLPLVAAKHASFENTLNMSLNNDWH